MNRKIAAFFVTALSLTGCSTPAPDQAQENAKREVASLENQHAKNLEVLKNLPLFKGVEKAEDNEDKISESLTKIFAKIQDESKAKKQLPYRGTHAKGSCFDGQLEVYSKEILKSHFRYSEEIATRLNRGFFSEAAKYPTLVRFANGKGQHNSDKVGDVRAISFAIDTRGHEASANGDFSQDFMFNNTPLFATRNIQEFHELLKAARLAQGDLSYFVNPFYFKSVLRAKNLLEKYERNDTVSYATEAYWSNVAYSYGVKPEGSPAEIVKFKMLPCDGKANVHEDSAKKADDFLQADIADRAQRGSVCFYMLAQLFDAKKLAGADRSLQKRSTVDWVENAGELWDEKILPYYVVAKLDLSPGKPLNCADKAFSTRIHSTRGLQPLGALSRVRSYVEETSRARRLGEK